MSVRIKGLWGGSGVGKGWRAQTGRQVGKERQTERDGDRQTDRQADRERQRSVNQVNIVSTSLVFIVAIYMDTRVGILKEPTRGHM